MDIVKVIIVDDSSIFRVGLETLLNNLSFIKVVGQAKNKKQFFEIASQITPDLVFMDIRLGNENGIEITKEFLSKYPKTKVIALTSSDELSMFNEMLTIGARGFLLKNIEKKEIEKAIKTVVNEETYFSKEFLISVGKNSRSIVKTSDIVLSEREKEVLTLICEGFSNNEIAERLTLSIHTIDAHRRNLLQKTGANNSASLVMLAVKEGLIDME